ncbi:MAG TPA: histidinol-phosphate transaminase [Steroidobacteraceae bacterium]|jgi:histidinol-phosphate aminotransferase|nr:histidinol-phosphate transaminase [Steroidobacteraceae bacterium]
MSLSRRDLLTASALLLAGPGMALRAAGRESVAKGLDNPVVLCWNENPYGPSPAARAAVSEAIGASCRYPDDELEPLVELLATREGVGTDQIVTGTGSGELLRSMGMLAARAGGEIVAAEPTYTELTRYAEGSGARIHFVPVDKQLRHDLAAMHAAVTASTRAVYVCNPNNPTGTTVPAADVRAFVAALPPGVTTIVDEAYMDFAVGPDIGSVVDLTRDRRVVVLRTFSKIHGMAGIRCGYAIARNDVAKELAAARMTTPNVFAVRAARASLGDRAFLADCRRRILASRVRITTELARLKLHYAEPQGNFVFFDTGMPLKRFTELMRARNILVGRRFAPYENWCRITIGTEPEVDAFLTALPAVIGHA